MPLIIYHRVKTIIFLSLSGISSEPEYLCSIIADFQNQSPRLFFIPPLPCHWSLRTPTPHGCGESADDKRANFSTHSGAKATGEDRVQLSVSFRIPMGFVECLIYYPWYSIVSRTLPSQCANLPLMWFRWSKGRESPSRSIHNTR